MATDNKKFKELKVQVEGLDTTSRLFVTHDRLLLEFGRDKLTGVKLHLAYDTDVQLDEWRHSGRRSSRTPRSIEWKWMKLFGETWYLVLKPLTMPTDPCNFLTELLDRDVTLAE